mmetsp:Transcript_52128/g.174013  ORF Transcript_52128/g.174013 Transcript_52128/m.174013 type:complete len:133 (+) Transcript_52128:297-695(+)
MPLLLTRLLRRHTCLSIAIVAVPACDRYALAKAQEVPPTPTAAARTLYVIEKRQRTAGGGGGGSAVLRLYYVLDGVVYEAPTLKSVLRSRLLRLSWLLESAFEAVRGVTAPQRAGGDAGPKGGGATAMDVGS